jgi:flagellar biosynthesis/type III secretory pathway protein FliH
MNYTVAVNEAKKEIKVMLDGYEGIARCCPTDNFNLSTGIELALERAKVAKANANKPKPTAKPTIAEAIKIVEEYVGDHIAIVGKGASLSENQKRELRKYADMYAPCECKDRYDEGYADGYDEGYADGCDECECDCECHHNEADEVSAMAKRMIARIEEILGD